MTSTDHPQSARAIAEELDILREGEDVLTAEQLDKMSQDELRDTVQTYSVYSRLSGQDKLRVIAALQAAGESVLLIGAEPDDTAAMQAADIGCALPHTTDIAKSAAGIIVSTSGFEAIAEAVTECRRAFVNINKLLVFLLGCGLSKAVTMLVAVVLGWGLPLNPGQLLLLSFVAATFSAVSIGRQPEGNELTATPAIPQSESIFAGGLGRNVILQGLVLSATALTGYHLGAASQVSRYLSPSAEMGMTMAFLVLFVGQLSFSLNYRSAGSLLATGLSGMKPMLRAVLAPLGVLAFIVSTPLSWLFGLSPLSMLHWLWAIALGLVPLFVGELAKATGTLKRPRMPSRAFSSLFL